MDCKITQLVLNDNTLSVINSLLNPYLQSEIKLNIKKNLILKAKNLSMHFTSRCSHLKHNTKLGTNTESTTHKTNAVGDVDVVVVIFKKNRFLKSLLHWHACGSQFMPCNACVCLCICKGKGYAKMTSISNLVFFCYKLHVS